MKYIITESQHKKLQMRQWLLRRYDLVMSEYKESVVEMNPCYFNNCEDYINRVVINLMDSLHHEYYLNDNFDYENNSNHINNFLVKEFSKRNDFNQNFISYQKNLAFSLGFDCFQLTNDMLGIAQ